MYRFRHRPLVRTLALWLGLNLIVSGCSKSIGFSMPPEAFKLTLRSTLCIVALAVGMLFPDWIPAQAEDPGPASLPSISERTEGMDHLEGYFNLHWDRVKGRLFWEMDKLDTEFLYQVSLASGLGSNPVGLDRGRLAGTYVLIAQRTGPRRNNVNASAATHARCRPDTASRWETPSRASRSRVSGLNPARSPSASARSSPAGSPAPRAWDTRARQACRPIHPDDASRSGRCACREG